jgi:hypothetical protein
VTTQAETITTIRNASHLNAYAMSLVRGEAQEQFDALRTWPNSGARRDLMQQLANVITSLDVAIRAELAMRGVADESLQSLSSAPVPGPPPNEEILTAGGIAQWSRRDW